MEVQVTMMLRVWQALHLVKAGCTNMLLCVRPRQPCDFFWRPEGFQLRREVNRVSCTRLPSKRPESSVNPCACRSFHVASKTVRSTCHRDPCVGALCHGQAGQHA